ncbi:hypothetical protein [Streptomyces regalis]|uniref:STAS/SEC14 domain-containing protein n=1 Tax=Streptomyces regalis TaxID=68262 RepID=A0A117ML52_9ACTN|nr:hypothetical protein [Streptomyces regalis]KUL23244.1 hypothetical protein ADL12_39905 [Streptomyces regalis]
MATMIVRMRVLTEAGSRVWIAVSGTLSPATQHHIQQRLHHQAATGTREFYLDLRESRCTDAVTREHVGFLFAAVPDAHFHLIAAPDAVRDGIGTDPRFTVHPHLASAWNIWSQGD